MSENKALTVTAKWNWQKKCLEVDPHFWDDIKVTDGAEITAVITTDRNPDQLKFYWWFLGRIVLAGQWEGDKNSLDDFTRMSIGFGKWRPIAGESAIVEPAWDAAWQTFLTLTGLERLKKHLRKVIETYVNATPQRAVFIPDSIGIERCDGIRFNEFMRDAEKAWAERLHVDVAQIMRDAPPRKNGVKHPDQINETVNAEQPTENPIEARLRALASRLRKDTPEAFDAAWAAEKVTEEALAIYRLVPKQLEAIRNLSAQTAGGNFNDVEYEEVLGKIIRAAGE